MIAYKFGLNEFIISTDADLFSEDNRRYNMTEGREYIAVPSLPELSEADQDTFNLTEIDFEKERYTRFYKEIIVDDERNEISP